jgi:hypothetical protein
VVDDLTVENKRLREKLRRFEVSQSPCHLEKDKSFEVKIHSLSSKKRRELDELLRNFASTLNDSDDGTSSNSKDASKGTHNSYPSLLESATGYAHLDTSISSTSLSRPVDSAYASMSASGPTSVSTRKHSSFARPEPQTELAKEAKEQKIHSYLDDIPEGFFPKHAVVMTERQKKKLVVRRLEQLFTGKVNGIVGDGNQPLQQQEVSKSAARADQGVRNQPSLAEGVREANILPQLMDMDKPGPCELANELSIDTTTADLSGAIGNSTIGPTSPDQRPTRPLDLDPDRMQIPSDNVEYIRHLGLSTPQLITQDSGDAKPDARGWIYLNLLISMAQLHIINVTPDFVRSAVEDVSAKFQLSHDGRRIRWRGGTEGSHFSSDSDASGGKISSPQDSDSLEESNSKRRKLEDTGYTKGRFASVPIQAGEPGLPKAASTHKHPLHYKPLFNHRNSEENFIIYDEEASNMSYTPAYNSGPGRLSRPPRMWGKRSRSGSSGRQRREDGPIVFYNGASFCTDLSGDRGDISTPLHVRGVGKDGYSDHTRDALGCQPRPRAGAIERTASGSLLQYRPFKEQSEHAVEGGATSIKGQDSHDGELSIDPGVKWSSRDSSPVTPLMAFNASGLGGTQPADHFAVTVKTRRTNLDSAARPKSSAAGHHARRFQHSIPKEFLDMFQRQDQEEDVMSKLAGLRATKSPSPHTAAAHVKTEVISTRLMNLQPSELPAPMAFYSDDSSSDEGSEWDESSYSGSSDLRQSEPKRYIPGIGTYSSQRSEEDQDMRDNDVDDEESESDDSSIDMLAAARELDPETVRAREKEFEMEVDRKFEELPAGSSAATVSGGSGYSSMSAEMSL